MDNYNPLSEYEPIEKDLDPTVKESEKTQNVTVNNQQGAPFSQSQNVQNNFETAQYTQTQNQPNKPFQNAPFQNAQPINNAQPNQAMPQQNAPYYPMPFAQGYNQPPQQMPQQNSQQAPMQNPMQTHQQIPPQAPVQGNMQPQNRMYGMPQAPQQPMYGQQSQPYNPQFNPQINPQMPQNGAYQNSYQNQGGIGYPNQNPNPYANPYTNNSPYQNAPQKKKKSAKTTVFIVLLCCLLAAFIVTFVILCVKSANSKLNYNNKSDSNSSSFSGDYFNNGSNKNAGTEFDIEVKLKADEGSTQIISGEKDNSATPDEQAPSLKETDLPNDKDSKNHTAQSAFEKVSDSVVGIVCYKEKISDDNKDILSEGTGTVVTSDGFILTNSHVIGNSKSYAIKVVTNKDKEYEAKVVGYDSRTDLAILKVDAKDLSCVTFGKYEDVKVGQDIVAIGNPGGTNFQNSLTAGIVSAVDREIPLNKTVKYIQIDAPINPGNSGGPLCNIYGQVIGINTAKISSSVYEGMGFAIPSSKVIEIANDLMHYGYVKNRVLVGITGTEITSDEVAYYGLPYGILVTEITKGGPLDGEDIKPGDIITAIDGESVKTFQDIYGILEKHKDGDTVKISVYRAD